MLVLSRKVGEELMIGDNIRIVINRVAGNRVAVAIEAPDHVPIMRGELKSLREQFAGELDLPAGDGDTYGHDQDCTVVGCSPRSASPPSASPRSASPRSASPRSAR